MLLYAINTILVNCLHIFYIFIGLFDFLIGFLENLIYCRCKSFLIRVFGQNFLSVFSDQIWHFKNKPGFHFQNQLKWTRLEAVRVSRCCCCLVTQSCSTLCDPMDPPGSSVHGVLQARIQEYWSGLPFPSPGRVSSYIKLKKLNRIL